MGRGMKAGKKPSMGGGMGGGSMQKQMQQIQQTVGQNLMIVRFCQAAVHGIGNQGINISLNFHGISSLLCIVCRHCLPNKQEKATKRWFALDFFGK